MEQKESPAVGSALAILDASSRASDARKALKGQSEYVAVKSGRAIRLFSAIAVRLRTVQADDRATIKQALAGADAVPAFIVDEAPDSAEGWQSIRADVDDADAPGAIVGYPGRQPRFVSVGELQKLSAGAVHKARRGRDLSDDARRYVCKQCAPPTYRRPSSGADPTCPADPLHGTMTEG